MPTPPGCAQHTAVIYAKGGTTVLFEAEPLIAVRWNRKRDEVSDAWVKLGVDTCCEQLGNLETTIHELHILRDGVKVWQGPITRLEYRHAEVQIFAEDVLWVAKRTALRQGYSHAYPNIGQAADRMDWLMRNMTFSLYGDPWKVVPRLHKVVHPTIPGAKTAKTVEAWSVTTWEDFDTYAEDGGMDYTVVNRDIYWWDINYAWSVLPALTATDLAEWPYITEYGNDAATHYIVTNNSGFAGKADAPASVISKYGHIDLLASTWNEAVAGTTTDPDAPPTPQELASMLESAQRQLPSHYPPPVQLNISDNSTLMPGAPWDVNTIIPGSWFNFSAPEGLCRVMTNEPLRLHEVHVSEDANAERVNISCVQAPATRLDPP